MRLVKFSLLSSKIGCILNSQVKFQIHVAEIVQNIHHMCAPKVVKTDRFLTEMFKNIKDGRFYWDTVYILELQLTGLTC